MKSDRGILRSEVRQRDIEKSDRGILRSEIRQRDIEKSDRGRERERERDWKKNEELQMERNEKIL